MYAFLYLQREKYKHCILTDMSGNIGCRPHDKINEDPVHTGANMDLSRDTSAAQDVADNLEDARHDYDLQELGSLA